jgi:hypothetical protein
MAAIRSSTSWVAARHSGSDEAALRTFARTDPHRTVMRRVRPWAKTATFRFWTVSAEELAPAVPARLWAEAERRISAQ